MENCVQNAPYRPEYVDALEALRPILDGLPAAIVATDAKMGVGKTTLGRFLPWRFNVSLLKTDLFLNSGRDFFQYKTEEVKAIIVQRLAIPRPIIVEGVEALRLLAEAELQPTFVIRVECEASEGSDNTNKLWLKYVSNFPDLKVAFLSLDEPCLVSTS